MKRIILLISIFLNGFLHAQNNFYSIPIGGNAHINDLITDKNENVFVATAQGIWEVNLFSNPLGSLYDNASGLSALPIYNLSVDTQGKIYASGSAKSFYSFDTQSKTWNSVPAQTAQSFSHFTYVFHAVNSTKYLGTDNGLVFSQTIGSNNLSEITQYTSALNLGSITSISQTANSSITAVLSTNGIVLDIQGFVLPVTAASLLPSDSVISGVMHRDVSYDGTIAGLYTADFSNGAPPSVFNFTTSNSGIPSNRVQALSAYGDSIFVGTDQGLAIYNLSSNTWSIFDKSNSNLPSNDIVHLTVSTSGRLWIATADNNLSTFSKGVGLEEQKDKKSFFQLIRRELYINGDLERAGFQIFSLAGQKVLSGTVVAQEKISLESLPSGIYWITVKEKSGQLMVDKMYLP